MIVSKCDCTSTTIQESDFYCLCGDINCIKREYYNLGSAQQSERHYYLIGKFWIPWRLRLFVFVFVLSAFLTEDGIGFPFVREEEGSYTGSIGWTARNILRVRELGGTILKPLVASLLALSILYYYSIEKRDRGNCIG